MTLAQLVPTAEPAGSSLIGEHRHVPSHDSNAERWDFPFGCQVDYGDWPSGETDGLTIAVATRVLTSLVVGWGRLSRDRRVVPIDLVESCAEGHVTLGPRRVKSGAGSTLPRSRPLWQWLSAIQRRPSDVLDPVSPQDSKNRLAGPTLTAATRVRVHHGVEGSLAGVLADSRTYRVTHVIVGVGRFRPRRLLVPIERVGEMDQDRLTLDIRPDELTAVPEYRPDDDVARAIWDDEIVRRLNGGFLDVTARKGVVTVAGSITESSHLPRVNAAVRRVRGVLGLRNEPIADDELEIAVAQELGSDLRTRRFAILVEASHGKIRLGGPVPTAARGLVLAVPGVRSVEVTDGGSQ